MSKDSTVPLVHIVERAKRIALLVASGKERFFSDPTIQDAVIRNFEVIGEATRRIPTAYREQHPEIPWRHLNAFRNALIHRYDQVELELVWQAASAELPPLIEAIERVLPAGVSR